jgi:hypothetical protein
MVDLDSLKDYVDNGSGILVPKQEAPVNPNRDDRRQIKLQIKRFTRSHARENARRKKREEAKNAKVTA